VILAVIEPKLHAWTGCRRETCVRYMYKTRNAIMIIAYFTTLVCFSITVVLIQRARRFVSSFHQSSTNQTSEKGEDSTRRRSLKQRFPLWKLAINVGTFAFFNLFYVVWAVVLVVQTDKCFFRRHFNLMIFLLGCVRLSLILRIAMDPVIVFITDLQIRRSLFSMLHLGSAVRPTDSKKRFAEENSSDAQLSHRLQRESTKTSNLPDRPSIKSISNNKLSESDIDIKDVRF